MRKRIVAGNWKMNLNAQQAELLMQEIVKQHQPNDVEVILIPPYVYLEKAIDSLMQSTIKTGAQNVHAQVDGAYTGEISAKMLQSIGVEYSLVGHSERRIYQSESEQELEAKIRRLLEVNIKPIYCVGESLEERKSNQHFKTVEKQLSILEQLSSESLLSCVLAYEPVWAIGTGETATAEQAEEMHAFIRQKLELFHGQHIADNISILYGGSCKPNNAKELFSQANVDGGLIGGASLNAQDFLAIIDAHS